MVYKGPEGDLSRRFFRSKGTAGKVLYTSCVTYQLITVLPCHRLPVWAQEVFPVINGPTQLSQPLQLLVTRALSLCELMLPHCQAIYPFAAIYEDGKIGCLFTIGQNVNKDSKCTKKYKNLEF